MSAPPTPYATNDGAVPLEAPPRRATRSPPRDETCCIFVHAGAGYHSHQNERIHLEACNDAAQIAMLILKNGGSAIDAVEAAIMTLEDREITNAGYGSNLAMDGVVECDASIVDHYGRCGAVGAVAQIKNPISVARLVHKHFQQQLTLRRVPPVLLVAQGATDFAAEQGIPILPYASLISPAAKERWLRWRADLEAAERKNKKTGGHPSSWVFRNDSLDEDYRVQRNIRAEHTKEMLRGLAPSLPLSSMYSSKPIGSHTDDTSTSPSDDSVPISEDSEFLLNAPLAITPDTPDQVPAAVEAQPSSIKESSRSAFINSTQKVPTVSQFRSRKGSQGLSPDRILEAAEPENTNTLAKQTPGRLRTWADGSDDTPKKTSSARQSLLNLPSQTAIKVPLPEIPVVKDSGAPSPLVTTPLAQVRETAPLPLEPTEFTAPPPLNEDHITDTVGAIAIDSSGRIACGASSGGIGMKYRGRIGPAALVGVGAAVAPVERDDPERMCVATVTSGTGEHMMTTLAAQVCADRLYQSIKKQKSGEFEEVTEDEALKAFIENDFMGHPSVKHSNSAGAIGVLGVKKIQNGILLYYGHNTDSFAMASMSSHDDVPRCTMSRSNGNGQIAQGGRAIPNRSHKKPKVSGRQRHG